MSSQINGATGLGALFGLSLCICLVLLIGVPELYAPTLRLGLFFGSFTGAVFVALLSIWLYEDVEQEDE